MSTLLLRCCRFLRRLLHRRTSLRPRLDSNPTGRPAWCEGLHPLPMPRRLSILSLSNPPSSIPFSQSEPDLTETIPDEDLMNVIRIMRRSVSAGLDTSSDDTVMPSHKRHKTLQKNEWTLQYRRESGPWEVEWSEVRVCRKIGSGSFGTVYRGIYFGVVAIKILNAKDPTPEELHTFRNKVDVLKRTRHINILLFMSWMRDPLAIITQWCEGSSLYKHVHVDEREFSNSEVISISKQTSQGMDYLHSKHIIHRDLKSQNILMMKQQLSNDETVKIADFGLATVKTLWSDANNGQIIGSLPWMAPEAIRQDYPCSFSTDVYAFGIVLFELMSGVIPYSHMDTEQIMYNVGIGHLSPDLSNCRGSTPSEFLQLIEECIMFEKEERPTFNKILNNLHAMPPPPVQRHRRHSDADADWSYTSVLRKYPLLYL